ncbi:hypothetical protein Tco_0402093 [Tanacetum coccineum]
MFIGIVPKDDNFRKEEPEAKEQEVEYFDIFRTRSELTYHKYLMCGPIPLIFLQNPIIMEGCPLNLKIPCNIGHVHVEKAYIDLNCPLNIMTQMMYNWIMRRKLDPRENVNGGVSNFTGMIKGMHVFVGNFTYIVIFDEKKLGTKRIFRNLKGQPKLGLWYPRDSPFDLEAFSDSDYAGASLDKKSITGGCQFLGKRLISWQCKKQTIFDNSTTETEYVAIDNCYGQVLWIQNQMLDYGFNFMNTKIHIDNESTIYGISDEFGVKTGSCKVNPARQDLVLLGESQPTEPQPTPSTTQPIIEEQILVTESSSPQNTQTPRQALQEDTQLPQTSVPIPNVADDAVFKEWDDIVVRATTIAASLDAAHASGNITKTQSTTMSNDPLSQETGSGDRPRWQETIGSVIAQTRFERTSKHSYDSPLPGVNTPGRGYAPGSNEGRPDLHELIAICTKLSDRNKIKKLEIKAKSSIPPPKKRLYKQVDSSADSLGEENASKQERNNSNKTEEFNLSDKGSSGTKVFDDTTTAEKDVNAAEPVSTAGDAVTAASIIPDIDTAGPLNVSAAGHSTSTDRDIFEDEMMTIADALVAIRSTRPRTTSVIVEPEPTPKNPIKAQIQRDAEIAQRLFEEDQAQFEREQSIARERVAEQEAKDATLIAKFDNVQARMEGDALLATIAERKRFFAAQRAEQIRNKPPTKTQLRNKMITYLKNMGRYTHSQLKNKSLEEIQKLYEKEQKWINDFVPMDSEEGGKKAKSSKKEVASSKKRQKADPDDENVKRQKLEDAAEKEGLKAYLKIVPDEDKAVNYETLATKYTIVDWESQIIGSNLQGNDLSYWKITRADGSSKFYKVFSMMLKDFDRQDLVDLHILVKEMSASRALEGYDLILWGDLKTMFEPSEEDDVWRNQQDWSLIS